MILFNLQKAYSGLILTGFIKWDNVGVWKQVILKLKARIMSKVY